MQKPKKSLFFPNGSNFYHYCKLIRKCEKRLLVCMYQITHQKLVNTLIHLSNRGKEIYIITHSNTDARQTQMLKDIFIKSAYKIQISIFESDTCLMHSKFCVIDDTITTVGSANWTYHAFNKNYENVLILKSSERAKEFTLEFQRIWEKSKQITLQGLNIIQCNQRFNIDKREQKIQKSNSKQEVIDVSSDEEVEDQSFEIEIIL